MPKFSTFCSLLPLTLLLSFLVSGCAGTQIIDTGAYQSMAQELKPELQQRGLPAEKDEISSASNSSETAYGSILFQQLSPDFMQGHTRTYYLGDTFAETMQPRRSTAEHRKNGFTINHVSQRIKVDLLASLDWDSDGSREWLIECDVLEKRGGQQFIWYVLSPEPENKTEILWASPIAVIKENRGQREIIRFSAKGPFRKEKESIPPTKVEEFTPGEETITSPTQSPASSPTSLHERTI